MGHPFDCSKAGFALISGVKPPDHISYIGSSNTPSGATEPGYPASTRERRTAVLDLVRLEVNGVGERYLIYHINKGLGILPTKILHHLSFITIGEDVCDQGGALIWIEVGVDQAFPRWNTPAFEEDMRLTFAWIQKGTYTSGGIRSTRGRR